VTLTVTHDKEIELDLLIMHEMKSSACKKKLAGHGNHDIEKLLLEQRDT